MLSTLHTNDAPSAITRLVEMGIEPFLVASALDCIVAQRLARKLCSSCKRRTIIPAQILRENGYKALVDLEAYEPVGCRRCGGSGYRGRVGLYEVMDVSPEIQKLALERRPAEEIRDVAVRQGMRRLRDDGLEKVRQGRTSIAEIARVIGSKLRPSCGRCRRPSPDTASYLRPAPPCARPPLMAARAAADGRAWTSISQICSWRSYPAAPRTCI